MSMSLHEKEKSIIFGTNELAVDEATTEHQQNQDRERRRRERRLHSYVKKQLKSKVKEEIER